MKDKYKYGTSQLFNFAGGSYLERTSRPVYALVFLLPFILLYELGTVLIKTNALQPAFFTHSWRGRVVAFTWMQRFLEYLGFGSKLSWIATPLAVVLILLALQMTSKKGWQVRIGDLFPMAFECVLLVIPLIVFGLLLNSPVKSKGNCEEVLSSSARCLLVKDAAGEALRAESFSVSVCASTVQGVKSNSGKEQGHEAVGGNTWPVRKNDSNGPGVMADIVTGIGAGIYEELIFRLVLICLLMILFNDLLRLSYSNSIVFSILVSAALFSAYHHIDFFSWQLYPIGSFNWAEFSFRTVAGVYFAVVFAIRGFGITAGTHIFYDIFATLLNSFAFGSVH